MAQSKQDLLEQLIKLMAHRLNPHHLLAEQELAQLTNNLRQVPAGQIQTTEQLYNAVLTGVATVYIAGGIEVPVQVALENSTGVADWSPEDGSWKGGSVLDQQSRDEEPLGDPIGLNTEKLRRLLGQGDIAEGLDVWLAEQGYVKSTAPRPNGPGPTSSAAG